MEMEKCRVITFEMIRAVVSREVGNETHHSPVKDIFKLKLSLEDETEMGGAVEKEFLCVTGAREAQLLEELKAMGVKWA